MTKYLLLILAWWGMSIVKFLFTPSLMMASTAADQDSWLGHDWSHHTALLSSPDKKAQALISKDGSVSGPTQLTSNSASCTTNDWLAWFSTCVRGTTLLNWKLRHLGDVLVWIFRQF